MQLGVFFPGRSRLHRLPVSLKLIGLAIGSLLAFQLKLLLLCGLLAFVLLLAVTNLPPKLVLAQLYPLRWVLLAILLAHGLLTNWTIGLVAVLRLIVLLLLAAIVSLTTRTTDLVEAIEQSLTPLRRFGVAPEKVSLTLLLTIRFIPVLLQEMQQIREAQWARGLDRHPVALLVPFLIQTLYLADRVAEALDARGVDE